MGAKKKGKRGKKAGRKEEDKEALECRFQQQEELTALSAIFQDEFQLISEEPFIEYAITILPHTGMESSLQEQVSIELQVRYPSNYPLRPPKLKVVPQGALADAHVHQLQDMLADQAAAIAREGRVMIFNLCEAAQEFLSAHQSGPDVSLWDQMQERSEDDPGHEPAADGWAAGVAGWDGAGGYSDSVDAGLFTEWGAEDETEWGSAIDGKGAKVAEATGVQQRPLSGGAGRRPRERPNNYAEADKTRPLLKAAAPRPRTAALPVPLKTGVPPAAAPRKQGPKVESPLSSSGSGGSGGEEPGPALLALSGSRAGRSSVSELLLNVRKGLLRVGNAMRQTVLPEWSRGGTLPVLEAGNFTEVAMQNSKGSAEEAPEDEEHGASAPGGASPSLERRWRALQKLQDAAATAAIRKDLLLGYMLRLLCAPRGMLPHALPTLTAQLTHMGLLPGWARDLVAHQPALFDKAFRAMLGKEAEAAEARCEPSTRWAVARFWKGALEQTGKEEQEAADSTSRYRADFVEEALLGRGGFGSVTLCTNKLDGRKYAIKKIRLRSNSPLVNAKILREVATLSRLQHQNVVRYYQAWLETGRGSVAVDGASEDPGESDGDWLTRGTSQLDGMLGTASEESGTVTGRSTEEGGQSQHLYIQMEYCPKTLRQMLDGSGPLPPEVAWRIFRQILDGLVHIHGNNTIHRDLTPNNIFQDPRGDIKIGDFGLAKFTDLEQAEAAADDNVDHLALPSSKAPPKPASLEGTGQVGTYLYTAPEIEQAWPKIDEKCDLYSLGIVLFELFHPFSTAMERAVLLQAVKQQGELPPTWVDAHPAQAVLVRWLVAPHPADRPAAAEVLRSELLPVRMQDEGLDDVLRMLHAGGDPTVCTRVMGALLDDDRLAAQAEGLPGGAARQDKRLGAATEATEAVLRLVKDVFSRHGAQPTDSGSMDMVDDLRGLHKHAVRVVDAAGNVLALRYDTRLPLAAQVAAGQLTSLRRYEIARVFRKGVGRSAPRELLQADLDLVGGSPQPDSRTLAEAEAIKVALEVVAELVPLEASTAGNAGCFCEVRLNHRELLSAVWSWAGVSVSDRQGVAQLLAIMATWPPRAAARKAQWPLIRRQLLQGLRLPESVVDRLQAVERRLSGTAEEALPRLRGALPPGRGTAGALEEVGSLVQHLRVWGISEHVTLDALMSPHDDCYSGAFFQVHLARHDPLARADNAAAADNALRGANKAGHSACIAVGGRYDGLLRRLWPVSAAVPAPGAVGLSLGVAKLVAAASLGSAAPPAVLVCSRGGGGLLRERMQVAAELWAGNVRAHLLQAAAPSLTEQYEYAHEHGIKHLVIITDTKLSAADTVKVRNLDARTEEEVQRADLVKHFSEPQAIRRRAFQLKHAN